MGLCRHNIPLRGPLVHRVFVRSLQVIFHEHLSDRNRYQRRLRPRQNQSLPYAEE